MTLALLPSVQSMRSREPSLSVGSGLCVANHATQPSAASVTDFVQAAAGKDALLAPLMAELNRLHGKQASPARIANAAHEARMAVFELGAALDAVIDAAEGVNLEQLA